jgi:hypothetical protein
MARNYVLRIRGPADGVFSLTASAGVFAVTGTTATLTTTSDAEDWQLEAGHFEPSNFALAAVYPLAGASANARHKWACPSSKYEVPIGVHRGAWPYKYELLDDGGATWLDIEAETLAFNAGTGVWEVGDGYGWLSGTAPASGGPWDVVVRVTDQEGSTLDLSWTITLDATRFGFVDPASGSDSTGDGSAGNPFASPKGLRNSGDFDDKIAVLVSAYTMDWAELGVEARCDVGRVVGDPIAWIAPDRTNKVVIDASTANRFANVDASDAFYCGFRINDCARSAASLPANVRVMQMTTAVDRCVFANLHFDNPDPGSSATDNVGCLFFPEEGNPGGSAHNDNFITRCRLDRAERFSGTSTQGVFLVDAYSNVRYLWEFNVADVDSDSKELIWPKGQNAEGTIRHNWTRLIIFNGHQAASENNEICYNRCYGDGESLYFNSGNTPGYNGDENNWVYRNNVVDDIRNRPGGDGGVPEMHAVANVVKGVMNPGTGSFATDERNLVLDGAANPFDANLNLTGSYRTTYLGLRGAEVA